VPYSSVTKYRDLRLGLEVLGATVK